MINGMTVEEYNARERRRGSIVAKLHGYIPLDYGDTEASLTAEYLEITGEPYKTQAEEMAAKVKAAEETRAQRIALRNAADRQSIVAARLAGFMDCSDVFDALGFDRVNASGETRSVMQVAYRWIADAGFEVEYIIPDGITDVPEIAADRLLRRRPACDCGLQGCLLRRTAATGMGYRYAVGYRCQRKGRRRRQYELDYLHGIAGCPS